METNPIKETDDSERQDESLNYEGLCICIVVCIFLVTLNPSFLPSSQLPGSTLIATLTACCKRTQHLLSIQNITNVLYDALV